MGVVVVLGEVDRAAAALALAFSVVLGLLFDVSAAFSRLAPLVRDRLLPFSPFFFFFPSSAGGGWGGGWGLLLLAIGSGLVFLLLLLSFFDPILAVGPQSTVLAHHAMAGDRPVSMVGEPRVYIVSLMSHR